MKTVYKNRELAHIWASNNVPEGRNAEKTFFFNPDGIFSYGKHFMIAKRHNAETVVMTLQGYSNSTRKQISYVREAVCHLNVVYCQDPEASVTWNKRAALDKIDETLSGMEKKGIRETTKDKIRAQAHYIAATFNTYYAAVNGEETCPTGPIALGEDFVEQYKKMRAAEEAAKQKKIKKDALEVNGRLKAWKAGEAVSGHGFHNHPVVLRVLDDRIQTSHGAEIPLKYARRLWTMIESVRKAAASSQNIDHQLGHYTLNHINADGSIKVGCHDISYEELHRMAVQLEYTA